MRRGFTLIELLVIVALIGVMMTVSVLSIRAGKAAARMRGATRAVFSTIRQARSIALVTKQPAILTFSTRKVGDDYVSKAEITSASLISKKSLMTSAGRPPRSIDGYTTLPTEDEVSKKETRQAFVVSNRDDASSDGGGHTVEEALFRPMEEEILSGVCIRVIMDDEEVEDPTGEVDEAKRSMVSTFSNIDALLGLYGKYRTEKTEAEEDASDAETTTSEVVEEERHIQWQSNGRTDPHAVYVYSPDEEWNDGWCVKADMYGVLKVTDDDEEDD